MMSYVEPQVYLACLGCYSAGILRGNWWELSLLDPCAGHCELTGCVNGEHEEYAIHDTDGINGVGEHEDLNLLVAIAEYASSNESDAIWYYWAEHRHIRDFALLEQSFEDAYCGEWESFGDYVEQSFDDCNEIPDNLAPYIDYDRVERDWSFDHTWHISSDGMCHVFRVC